MDLFNYDPFGTRNGGLGIDITDGDLVENIPGTDLGIDLETGQLELNLGGIDIPL
jgi:hypothetical protein